MRVSTIKKFGTQQVLTIVYTAIEKYGNRKVRWSTKPVFESADIDNTLALDKFGGRLVRCPNKTVEEAEGGGLVVAQPLLRPSYGYYYGWLGASS